MVGKRESQRTNEGAGVTLTLSETYCVMNAKVVILAPGDAGLDHNASLLAAQEKSVRNRIGLYVITYMVRIAVLKLIDLTYLT